MSWSLPESAQRIPLSHRSPVSPTDSEVQLGQNRGHSLAHSVPRQAPSLWPGSEPLVHSFTGKTAGRRAHALIPTMQLPFIESSLKANLLSFQCFGWRRLVLRGRRERWRSVVSILRPVAAAPVKSVIWRPFLSEWENVLVWSRNLFIYFCSPLRAENLYRDIVIFGYNGRGILRVCRNTLEDLQHSTLGEALLYVDKYFYFVLSFI